MEARYIKLLSFGVGGIFIAIALFVYGFGYGSNREITALDRGVVLTAETMATYVTDMDPSKGHVDFSKRHTWNGITTIRYQFTPAKDALHSPGLIHVTAFYPSVQTARAGYDTILKPLVIIPGSGVGWGSAGVSMKTENDIFSGGDDSTFVTLINQDKPVGNTFNARIGTAIISTTVLGITFRKGGSIDKIMPRLFDNIKKHPDFVQSEN